MTAHPPVVWRHPVLRLALAAAPTLLTGTVVFFNTPWSWKALVGSVFAATLWSPYAGFLATVALAPLGQLIGAFITAGVFRTTEAIVLAFAAAWLLRPLADRQGPRVAGAPAAWLFALALAVSVGTQAARLAQTTGEGRRMLELFYVAYYLVPDRFGLVDSARLVEGIAMAAAAVILLRQRPRLAVTLPAVVVGSAAVAAGASVLLWYGIAPETLLKRHALLGDRVSAHVADVNAAGSYFALAAGVAGGMAARARGRGRLPWAAGAVAALAGLWLSGSRSAFAAVGLVGTEVAVWLITARGAAGGRRAVIGTIAAAAVVGGLAVAWSASDSARRSAVFRAEFTAASLRMIRARPWFGVGAGQYRRASALFLGPPAAWAYGTENAHDYYLQVAAETGLVGFGLFVLWVGAGVVRIGRGLRAAPADGRLMGLAAGLAAFLVTIAAGHPLLIDEVAEPFWATFGLAVGLAGSTLLARSPQQARVVSRGPARRAAWAAAAFLIASAGAPSRWKDLPVPHGSALDGFFEWETAEDGARFRWTGEYASLFVPPDVRRVEIPVRVPPGARNLPPISVEARIDDRRQDGIAVGDQWSTIVVDLPDAPPPAQWKRVNLHVDRTWQPALYIAGSADLRSVGIQVGVPRVFPGP